MSKADLWRAALKRYFPWIMGTAEHPPHSHVTSVLRYIQPVIEQETCVISPYKINFKKKKEKKERLQTSSDYLKAAFTGASAVTVSFTGGHHH